MCKSDKELTVEIVNNYVSSWNASGKGNLIKAGELVDLIKAVYETLYALDLPEDDEM